MLGPARMVTPLTTGQCLCRLSEDLQPRTEIFGESKLVGSITGGAMEASLRQVGDTAGTVRMTASFDVQQHGTQVVCRFGVLPGTKFGAFAVVALVLGTSIHTAVKMLPVVENPWHAFGLPMAISVVTVLLCLSFIPGAAYERTRLVRFMTLTSDTVVMAEDRSWTRRSGVPPHGAGLEAGGPHAA